MIYFAQRTSNAYTKQLQTVRESNQAHNLCAVIGGLSFLHALSSSTQSLILVDSDPDTHLYCRMIWKLLSQASSAPEFLEMLTNHKVSNNWWVPGCFGESSDFRPKARGYLQDTQLISLYDETYGLMQFDSRQAVGKIKDATIKCFGNDLTPMNFCWGLGSGAFSNDASFKILQEALARLSPQYLQQRLEDLDYNSMFSDVSGEVIILASNAESPLFTKGDVIFRNIAKNITKSLRYISWHRNIKLLPLVEQQALGLEDLQTIVTNSKCFSLADFVNTPKLTSVLPHLVVYESLEELRQRIHYGWGTFFINSCAEGTQGKSVNIEDILIEIIPSFSQLVIWGQDSVERVMKSIEVVRLETSYDLSKLSWYADNFLMCWEIKGGIEAINKQQTR